MKNTERPTTWLGMDPGDVRWLAVIIVTVILMCLGIGVLGWWWVVFPGYILCILGLRKLNKYHSPTSSAKEPK